MEAGSDLEVSYDDEAASGSSPPDEEALGMTTSLLPRPLGRPARRAMQLRVTSILPP